MTAPREIFDCERVRAYLESYVQGQIPPPEARGMRLHIHACPDCHARVVARDPVQLFAPLADEEPHDAAWAGFWPAVRADIHAAEAEASGWRAALRRPALAWAAAAAMLLIAAAALVRPVLAPGAPPSAAVPAVDPWQAVIPASAELDGPEPPIVEDVGSPSARVLSMKVVGKDRAVTEVVLIVDEEIPL